MQYAGCSLPLPIYVVPKVGLISGAPALVGLRTWQSNPTHPHSGKEPWSFPRSTVKTILFRIIQSLRLIL